MKSEMEEFDKIIKFCSEKMGLADESSLRSNSGGDLVQGMFHSGLSAAYWSVIQMIEVNFKENKNE